MTALCYYEGGFVLRRRAHAEKEYTHQLALPWGTRHLISPDLAGKDVMDFLLLRRRTRALGRKRCDEFSSAAQKDESPGQEQM